LALVRFAFRNELARVVEQIANLLRHLPRSLEQLQAQRWIVNARSRSCIA
jgi:hypothetical protein